MTKPEQELWNQPTNTNPCLLISHFGLKYRALLFHQYPQNNLLKERRRYSGPPLARKTMPRLGRNTMLQMRTNMTRRKTILETRRNTILQMWRNRLWRALI